MIQITESQPCSSVSIPLAYYCLFKKPANILVMGEGFERGTVKIGNLFVIFYVYSLKVDINLYNYIFSISDGLV